MKILITGATEFLGSNLARKLIEKGHFVTAVVRKQSDISFLKKIGAKIIYCDLNKYRSLKKELEHIDVVYYLAAIRRGTFCSAQTYYKVNAKSAENIILDCPKNLYRFIYRSSAGAHGEHFKKSELPVNESYPRNSSIIHEVSKRSGENSVRKTAKLRNIPYTIIRPGVVYGPRNTSMIKMFRLIKKNKFFIFAGKGDNIIHPTYVADTVDGFLLAMKSEKAINEDFIIAGKETTTTNQFISAIAESLNVDITKIYFPKNLLMFSGNVVDLMGKNLRTDFPVTKVIDFLAKNRTYDCSKAKKLLNYKAEVGIKEGIKRTIEWYEKKGYI